MLPKTEHLSGDEQKFIHYGTLVEDLLEQEVWVGVIQPAIDRLIKQVIGDRSESGEWRLGHFVSKDKNPEYYHGYVSGIIELNTLVRSYVKHKTAILKNKEREHAINHSPEKGVLEQEWD